MSKDQLVLVGAKVPTQWKEQIEALAESRGQNPSEVIREAIAGYLKLKPDDRNQSLAWRVRQLELAQDATSSIAHQPATIAPQSVPKKAAVRLDVQGDKASCPACGLNLTRREGYGKTHRSGENIGQRKQRWTCLNPECDRCGKSFLGNWAG